MPRRTATPATPAPPAPLPPPPRDLQALAESDPQWADNLRTLRRNWKWANFSQFFYTFAPLLNMPDVFLSDVEDDLARGTNLYLPRIMHRLLYTLSQDRKLSIDNWQTALRRQYLRRDPAANPIGPEPKVPSRESSVAPSEEEQEEAKEDVNMDESRPEEGAQSGEKQSGESPEANTQGESSSEPKAEPAEDGKVPVTDKEDEPPKVEEEQQEESKDWLDLPMLDKLDSLHLLTEWQFQNPHRVRQLMKDDDDAANWRIEPIGYDAKTNAYWLIGPDRLWIQRVPPRPPRNRTLKRKRPTAPPKKPARKAPETSSDEEEDEPVAPSKRTRTQASTRSTRSQPQAKANGRSTRTSRRNAQSSDTELLSPGKSTRAAKVQANKKLDLQAKELAEFQRQSAALARSQTSPRKARGAPASPSKRDRAVGTRISARLRGSARGGGAEDDSDEEWQQVPEEWLQEEAALERRTRTRTRSKGKARAEPEEDEPEDEPEAEEEQADAEEEQQADAVEPDAEKGDVDDGEVADGAREDTNTDDLLQKAGLESGSVSDLTDLSDAEEDEGDAAEEDEPEDAPPAKRQRGGRRGRGGRRKSAASTRTRARRGRAAAEAPSTPAKQTSPSKAKAQAKSKSNLQRSNSKSKSKPKSEPEADPEPEREPEQDQEMEEPPEPPLPEGFVEWEAIAVTLSEWEHVADPFEKATHYLEKALYKMLTQNIVPLVTADLREAERRRRMEEAIVHRKRSSRIAMKESEQKEAMIAAKMKAEEEEKNSRAKRMEARQRKEEEERAKREKAREQRAKEREEREARARAKAERAEREEAEATRSTATPVNGTHQSSLQPSRMVTPNGVRTPDWVLDCEICRKQGVNVDDGMAMVSCGSCNRWQHIKCHDIADQRAGRPRRDWEKQQFYCMRCRQRAVNGGAYGTQGHSMHQQQQPYGWQQQRTGGPIHLHKPGGMDPYAQTSDMRYTHSQSHRSPAVESRGGMAYPQQQPQQPYLPNNVGAASYSRSSYPNGGLPFHHYQPDQRGLSSRGVPSTPQGPWSSNGGGYGGAADALTGRMSSSQFAPQYNGAGMYGGSRMSAGYQNHASPSISQYSDHGAGMSTSRWSSSQSNGYHSPAVQEAAQSLAFMHDTASSSSSRYGNSSWPAQSSSYSPIPASSSQSQSQSHHSHSSYAPPPPGIDPLTGQPFPRVEQHVGHGLTHSSSSGSFNFPS